MAPLVVEAGGSRLENIKIKLTAAVSALETVSSAVQTPFLAPICLTVQSILPLVQIGKPQGNETLLLLEQTHQLLLVVVSLHIKAEENMELPAAMLGEVANFASILHKVYSALAAQQEGSRIWKFFRKGELNTMVRDCTVLLEQCMDAFKVKNAELLHNIIDFDATEDILYQEVLELAAAVSDGGSTLTRVLSMAYNSSKSLSLLPPEPKIFHGRDSELAQILDAFTRESPRIVILGAGGMGKTSLARAVLHHADIVPKYPDCRVFVACESASTSAELLPLLGAHIGLSAMESVTGRVVQHFANSPPTLLILDNLETVWESHSRKDVEDLLSRLSDIKHLALIVTMRGVERPDKVKWTQPFLRPLQPLSPEAARQTFLEIADSVKYTEVEIDQVLALTDNMPLAIDLIAHLVDSESCATVLSRFEGEKTSLLSEGVDRRSNLDMSISISLSSPRLVAIPSAIHLLSLLSILPDGLADAELLPSRLPVANILECKRALLRTSLAYTTNQRRLKVLVPIREHMQRHHPPDVNLVNSVFHLYRQLLELYARSRGTIESPQMASQIGSNFGNIQNVISFTMSHSSLDLEDIVSSVRMLNMFGRITGGRRIPLMTEILQQLPPSLDPDAEVGFLTEYLSLTNVKMPNIEELTQRASDKIHLVKDPAVECRFYLCLGKRYAVVNLSTSEEFYRKALDIAESTNDYGQQAQSHIGLATVRRRAGDHHAARLSSQKAQVAAILAGDLLREARALYYESTCLLRLGNYPGCLTASSRAQSLLAICGLSESSLDFNVRVHLAEVHKMKSEHQEALRMQQALQNLVLGGSTYRHGLQLLNFAELGILMEAPATEVQINIEGARKIFEERWLDKNTPDRSMCDATQADLWLREGNTTAAKEMFQNLFRETCTLYAPVADFCLERLADVARWENVSDLVTGTTPWSVIFLAQCMLSKQRRGIYKSLQFLGDAAVLTDEQTGQNLLLVALEGFAQMDIHSSRAECMLRLGNIAKKRGEAGKARQYWETAAPLFERSSQTSKAEVVWGMLSGMGENGRVGTVRLLSV